MSDKKVAADRPTTADGRQYHLETAPGDLAPHCLLVGSPERAELIATKVFRGSRKVGDHRGLKSFTGRFGVGSLNMPISVVTTGMGSATTGIVLPEAVRCGARLFIRVGSCAALQPGVPLHAAAICTGAVRLDGAGENWAPIEWPAVADWRVVGSLAAVAQELGLPHAVGIGVTTTCFNEGQARPDDTGYIPPRLLALHEELVRRGALFYSMEEATLFVWCATHGQVPCGAVDAVYGNRADNTFQPGGDEDAGQLACHAMLKLCAADVP